MRTLRNYLIRFERVILYNSKSQDFRNYDKNALEEVLNFSLKE